MALFFVVCLMLVRVQATLTQGGTASAKSTMAGFSITTLNDGNFSNLQTCTDCPGCFSTDFESGPSWISVKLLHPTLVKSVLIVNREDAGLSNLAGSQIRIGFSNQPSNNELCQTVSTSGIYTCTTGILGEYVGLYNQDMLGLALQLCEIRAYPWVANQFVTSIVASSVIPGFPADNALSFSTSIISETIAKNNKQVQARYDYMLDANRHVYATVVIGDPSQDFKNAKDWYITAGSISPLVNPSFTSYQTNADRFGHETHIQAQALTVSFIRMTNTEQWNIVYAAVFASSVDCSTFSLNWSEVIAGNPFRIKLRLVPQTTLISLDPQTDPACYLYYTVTDTNGFPVPEFMTVDATARKLSISPTLVSQTGSYNLKVFASYWDGVSPYKGSAQSFTVVVFCAETITIVSSTRISSQVTYSIGSSQILLPLPSYNFSPSDAEVNFIYSIQGQPTFVTIQANNIKIYTLQSSFVGDYSISITISETISGLTDTTSFILHAECTQTITPNGSQNNVMYIINDSPLTLNLPTYTTTSFCQSNFVYSLKLNNGSALPAPFTSFNSNPASLSVTIYSTNASLAASYRLVLKIQDTGTLNYNDSIQFDVTIYCVQGVVAGSVITEIIYVINPATSTPKVYPAPLYLGSPSQCPTTLAYDLTLTRLSGPTPFLTFDSVTFEITIATNEFGFIGEYSLKLVATDRVSGRSSPNMIFPAKLVCKPNQLVLVSGTISAQIYLISSAPIVKAMPTYQTLPAVCQYQSSLSFHLQDINNPAELPAFMSPANPTTDLTIFTNDTAFTEMTFTFKLSVSFAADPSITDEMTFAVSIRCEVLQIALSEPLANANVTYIINPVLPSLLPIGLPTYAAIPNCTNNFQFSLSPVLAFVVISGQNINVQTGDQALVGSYQLVVGVEEQFSSLSDFSQTFTLVLRCGSVTFGFTSELTNMVYSITTQAQVQQLPSYSILPALCESDFVLMLENSDGVPTPFMSPLASFGIQVYTSDVTMAGSYTFRLVSNDLLGNQLDQLSFTVQIKCAVLSIEVQPGLKSEEYKAKVSTNPIKYTTFAAPAYTWTPAGCPSDIQVSLASNGSPSTQPFISIAQSIVKVGTDSSMYVGLYIFQLVALDTMSGVINTQVSFEVRIQASQLTITSQPLDDIVYIIETNSSTSTLVQLPVPTYNTLTPNFLTLELVLISFSPLTGLRRLQSLSFPPFITRFPTERITLATGDSTQAGIYTFRVIARDAFSEIQNDEITFQITLQCQTTSLKITYTPQTMHMITFKIGSVIQSIPLPAYEALPKGCAGPPITYELIMQSGSLPSFIWIDETTKMIKLSGGLDSEARQDYAFEIWATSGSVINKEYSLIVQTVLDNIGPQFTSELENITVTLGSAYPTWQLPSILDAENNEVVKISVDLGKARVWLSFSDNTFSIDSALIEEPGEFPITVSLVDDVGSTSNFIFLVTVQAKPIEPETKKEEVVLRLADGLNAPDSIGFLEGYDFNKSPKGPNQNVQQNEITIEPLEATLDKPGLDGTFKLKFSDLIYKLVLPFIKDHNLVEISIKWKNPDILPDDIAKPSYSWHTVSMTNDHILFKIDFDEPLLISQGKVEDQLVLNITQRTYFRRRTDNEALNVNSLFFTVGIPPQAPNEEEAVRITSTLDQFKGMSSTTLFILAFYGLMNLPKELFWSLHATIQFIMYEPQHGGKFPANVMYMYTLLNKLSNMTFDQAEKWMRYLFNPKLPDGVNNSMVEAGIFLLVFVVIAVATLLFLLFRKLIIKSKYGRLLDGLIMTEIRRTLMFSFVLRFAQLGYMYIVVKSVSAVIGGNKQNLFGTNGEKVNSIIYIALFVFAILWPIIVTTFLMVQGPLGLAKESVIEKFRSLYLSVRLNSRLTILITVLFLARRATVGTSIALLGNYYSYQLVVLQVSCLGCLIYDWLVVPFARWRFNLVEIMNESFLIITVYMLHLFSDFVPDEIVRYQFGWYYIYLVFLVFILNMLIIGGSTLFDLYYMWRFYQRKKNLKKRILRALAERKRQKKALVVSKADVIMVPNPVGLLESIKEMPSEESKSSSSDEEVSWESVCNSVDSAQDENVLREIKSELRLIASQEDGSIDTHRPLLLTRPPKFESPRPSFSQKAVAIPQNSTLAGADFTEVDRDSLINVENDDELQSEIKFRNEFIEQRLRNQSLERYSLQLSTSREDDNQPYQIKIQKDSSDEESLVLDRPTRERELTITTHKQPIQLLVNQIDQPQRRNTGFLGDLLHSNNNGDPNLTSQYSDYLSHASRRSKRASKKSFKALKEAVQEMKISLDRHIDSFQNSAYTNFGVEDQIKKTKPPRLFPFIDPVKDKPIFSPIPFASRSNKSQSKNDELNFNPLIHNSVMSPQESDQQRSFIGSQKEAKAPLPSSDNQPSGSQPLSIDQARNSVKEEEVVNLNFSHFASISPTKARAGTLSPKRTPVNVNVHQINQQTLENAIKAYSPNNRIYSAMLSNGVVSPEGGRTTAVRSPQQQTLSPKSMTKSESKFLAGRKERQSLLVKSGNLIMSSREPKRRL